MFNFQYFNSSLEELKEFGRMKKKYTERVKYKNEEEMKYLQLLEIVNDYESGDAEKQDYYYPLPSFSQFEELEMPSMNIAFALMKHYDLENIVERTLNGERTMLINSMEKLNKSTLDMCEYNKIILYKRLAFITNFLALFVFRRSSTKTLEQLGYVVEDNTIISERFYDSSSGVYKSDKICTFFDGTAVRVGRWRVDQLYKYAKQSNTILFVPQESLYPLNLCLELNKEFEVNVINTELYKEMICYEKDVNSFITMQLYDAVPGSGKTTKMLEHIEIHRNALVIVPTRVERDELGMKGINVYTADALHHRLMVIGKKTNMFEKLKTVENIYIDECFMLHSGQIRWILLKLKEIFNYKHVYFYGDKGQIPFYAYVPVKIEKSRELQNEIKDVVDLNITFRCPQKMTILLSNMYKREITSASHFNGVFESKMLTIDTILFNLKVLQEKKVQIMTYSQTEKEYLNMHGIPCITVAESQGMTFDEVYLVRLNQYERMIYYSSTHILVALSRIRSKFMYYTVVEDKTTEVIEKIENGKDVCLDSNDRMLIGKYKIQLDEDQQVDEYRLDNDDIFSNLRMQKQFAVKTYSKDVNEYFCESVLKQTNIDKDSDEIIGFMNRYMVMYAENYPKRFYDQNDYMDKVWETKEMLEEKGVIFNDNKIISMMNDENRNYQTVPYYDIIRTSEPGTFKLNTVPKARLDKVDLLSLFNSIYKRNADPGRIRDFMMTLDPSVVVERFMKVFVDSEKYEELKEDIHLLDKNYLKEWRQSRTLQQLNKLDHELENIDTIDFTSYSAFIKTIVKNKVDDTQYDMGQAAQIVAGAHAVMVEYFTPMVKRFTDILKTVLKSNVLINDGITNDYLEWYVNNTVQNYILKNGSKEVEIMPFEMDYSKFDKNQDWIDLYYQLLIMKRFGISEQILKEWAAVHLITTLKFQAQGITMTTFTQRKSGDAFTFMGNTLFTMLMYSAFYDDVDAVVMLFGGDDSLILYDSVNEKKIKDCSDWIAAAFNMEIKYMNTSKSVMFASKMFVFTQTYIYVFPDVLKQFLRYNRKIKTKEHAIAQQISSIILNKGLFYAPLEVFDLYFEQLFDRYKLKGEVSEYMFMVLVSYLQIVFMGKTYLFYKDYQKVRNATFDEIKKIKEKMTKKIKFESIKSYEYKNNWEKLFLENYIREEYIDIKFENELTVRSDISINLMHNEDFKMLYQPLLNGIRSYCDKNQISYSHLKTEKENLNYLMVNYGQKKNGLFSKMYQYVKSLFGRKNEVQIKMCISGSLLEIVDIDEFKRNLSSILCNLNSQMETTFYLQLELMY